ncbi:transcriptional regulator [Polaromonas hydrogenivorans]|uniref:YdaS family helix-turn-helix protein n=1 Tax=Polaromonas hydrogenivorans TaxID=335476 RepID=A0AAU7LWF5_9BURK
MELKSWLEGESGRAVKLAAALKVYPSFVSKIANGTKPVPFEQCMPIERATEGAVTRRDLKPDDYLIHWPELAYAHTEIAQPAINAVAVIQTSIKHVEAVAVAAIRDEASQATAEIKHVATELLVQGAATSELTNSALPGNKVLINNRRTGFVRRIEDRVRLGLDIGSAGQGV